MCNLRFHMLFFRMKKSFQKLSKDRSHINSSWRRLQKRSRRVQRRKKLLSSEDIPDKDNYRLRDYKKPPSGKYLQGYIIVKAPKKFSLVANTEEMIRFINRLEYFRSQRVKKVFVDMRYVSFIDNGASIVLLSIIERFREAKVKFNGNFPIDAGTRKKMKESGFFAELSKDHPEYYAGHSTSKSRRIVTNTSIEVDSNVAADLIRTATPFVFGCKKRCPGIQRTLVELMHNTNNHAAGSGNKHSKWWMSIDTNIKGKTVAFSFIDYGIGIFSSLKSKKAGNQFFGWAQKLLDSGLGDPSRESLFQMILEGKFHATVTDKSYRGKGLPGIYQSLERNQMSKLFVVTNNVRAYVEEKRFDKIQENFDGTYYYFELTDKQQNLSWNE